MRCSNCGWPNKPEATNCVKCGEPLTNDASNYNGGTVRIGGNNPMMPDQGGQSSNLRATVLEVDSEYRPMQGMGNEGSNGATVQIGDEMNMPSCPKCGYPLSAGSSKCPNCNTLINGAATVKINGNEMPRENVQHHSHKRQTTMNPWLIQDPDPVCTLKPIKKIGERRELGIQEFEGTEIVLNRSNTDPDNGTITSKEQAVITNIDGSWFIQDKSEQKSTFLLVSRKTELKDGDLILMGNRIFEFHVE